MQYSVLLDTNALIWLLDPKSKDLGKKAIKTIKVAETVYVSAASVFELQIKAMLGKIKIPRNLLEIIEKSNIKYIDITAQHAFSIGLFKELVKHDPFDRIILSQANQEKLTLVTADEALLNIKNINIQIINARV